MWAMTCPHHHVCRCVALAKGCPSIVDPRLWIPAYRPLTACVHATPQLTDRDATQSSPHMQLPPFACFCCRLSPFTCLEFPHLPPLTFPCPPLPSPASPCLPLPPLTFPCLPLHFPASPHLFLPPPPVPLCHPIFTLPHTIICDQRLPPPRGADGSCNTASPRCACVCAQRGDFIRTALRRCRSAPPPQSGANPCLPYMGDGQSMPAIYG